MITTFDIIVFGIAIIVLAILLLLVSVREGFLGIKSQKQLQTIIVSVVFIPVVSFYAYKFLNFEPLDNQVYERYYGKFDRIVQITGSHKYPDATVKTSGYTLYDMNVRYFEDVSIGDKIYYRVEGDGRAINTYYVVGGKRYGVSSCYYPMSCWDNMIEKFDFVTGEQDDISPYIRRP